MLRPDLAAKKPAELNAHVNVEFHRNLWEKVKLSHNCYGALLIDCCCTNLDL